MSRKVLTADELAAALAELPDWSVQDGKLHRQYKFVSFAQAMGWMMSAAIEADKLDHHPEWSNVYNRVEMVLTTHDAGGLTQRDFDLARFAEAAARA